MVLSFPFSLGFGLLCVLGSLMSISSSHWLGIWLGLEINLMGFIPLLAQGGGGQVVESAVKYFIVQALGSGFFLLGGFSLGNYSLFWGTGFTGIFLSFFLLFGLLLKLGVAPFHWWVPSVMGGASWVSCGILATWQKLAPFFVLISFSSFFLFSLFLFACVSSLLGGVSGIGQVQLRLLMAYSSVAHLGWMMGLLACSVMGGVMYFFFYFFLSGFLFYFLSCGGLWRINQVGIFLGVFILVGFLSLGGLPPLSGFVPKWVGLQLIGGSSMVMVVFFLVIGSLLSLYYYLSVLFLFFVSSEVFSSCKKMVSFSFVVPVGVSVFCLGFPFYEIIYFVF